MTAALAMIATEEVPFGLFTAGHCGAIFQCSARTIQRRWHDGKLPFVDYEGTRYMTYNQIKKVFEALENAQTVEHPASPGREMGGENQPGDTRRQEKPQVFIRDNQKRGRGKSGGVSQGFI